MEPLATYYHAATGRRYWVKLHPADSLAGLPKAYLTNPHEHVPKLQKDTQKFEAWGIDDLEGDEKDEKDGSAFPKAFLRTLMTVSLYSKELPTPQSQFIKHLITLKERKLMAQGKSANVNCDYVLKIVLGQLKASGGEDLIWRRFKISSAMRLNTFQDRIIQPVMGWERNYHAYLFTDRTDGSLFGPTRDAAYTDIIHMSLMYYDCISDENYTIADILLKEGDTLGYMYDLCAHWQHEIILEKIYPASESTGKFELLDGSGACPGEDMKGNKVWAGIIAKLRSKPNDRRLAAQIKGQLNYRSNVAAQQPNWVYDPSHFDLTEARLRVKRTLASFASEPKGAKIFMCSIFGLPVESSHRGNLPGSKEVRECMHNGSYLFESVRVSEPKHLSLCENCGKPDENLLRCAGCKNRWYCTRECQAARWKEHRAICKQIQQTEACFSDAIDEKSSAL